MGVKMVTAYVLLNTDLGAETEVMNDMKMIVEIKEAHMVYGVYDIIARIEADTMEDLKNIISWKVRRLNRVRSTLTMITVWARAWTPQVLAMRADVKAMLTREYD